MNHLLVVVQLELDVIHEPKEETGKLDVQVICVIGDDFHAGHGLNDFLEPLPSIGGIAGV